VIARLIVNAVALIAAALLVPQVHLAWGKDPVQSIVTIAVVTVIFALVNSYVRPVLRALSLPLNLLTLGGFSFVLNTALLLGVAWAADKVWGRGIFHLGTFPPKLTAEAVMAAALASVVISVVSTAMSVLVPDA
jgi:putative membrane protein